MSVDDRRRAIQDQWDRSAAGWRARRAELQAAAAPVSEWMVEAIAPQPGELVLKKAAASAFHGTPLVFQLNGLGADTVIACGETTSGCVRASVVDGATYRYQMGVVEECTFDRGQASHAITLFDMQQKYADVVSLAETLEYLRQLPDGLFDTRMPALRERAVLLAASR